MYRYTCPTCKKTMEVAHREDAPFRPFCSDRCKMIDLGHWFNETYRVSDPLTGASEDPLVEPAETDAFGREDRGPMNQAGDTD